MLIDGLFRNTPKGADPFSGSVCSRFTFWNERNLPGPAGVTCPYLRSTMELRKGSSSKEDGGLVSKRRDVVVGWAKLASLAETKITKY